MLDGIWVDNVYMDKFRDFTIDQASFGDIKALANELHTAFPTKLSKYKKYLIQLSLVHFRHEI